MGLARIFGKPATAVKHWRLACNRSSTIGKVVRLLATQPRLKRRQRPSFLFQLLVAGILFGVLVPVPSSHGGAAPEPEEEIVPGEGGWVSLFEGDSLQGWKSTDAADWNIVDSVLTGWNGGLLNRWCWVDFELKLVFQGSGLLRFRVGSDQMGHIGFDQSGYALDLAAGALHTAKGKLLVKATGPWFSDGWHSLTLTANQGIFKFAADNGPVTEVSNADSPLKGRIGFDAKGDGLQVKYLRIRPLNVEKLRNIPADNYYCYVCHANFEYEEPLAEVHVEAEVGCAECHGPSLAHRSDEDNVTPPDIIYRRSQVDVACVECHTRHEERGAPADKPLPEDPVCTDCHGEHQIFG